MQTLEDTAHTVPNLSSGDASYNVLSVDLHSNNDNNAVLSPKHVTITEQSRETQSATDSKAIADSDDEFDVNEYFARLLGTKYVSAPINSALKEDNNANLEATEENLEEIDLNEERTAPNEDVQHSLTADIAQNFSQLPTVLPQVASAVFSSFSNMLSLKSREQTPVETRPSPEYQDVQFQRPEVPLMGMGDYGAVKEVAPPPKEPLVGGAVNYRIATKKKAYAQIPGLSSGDVAQVPYNTMGQISVPSNIPPSIGSPPVNVYKTERILDDGLKSQTSIPSYYIPSGVPPNNDEGQTSQATPLDVEKPPMNIVKGEGLRSDKLTQQISASSYYVPSGIPPDISDGRKPEAAIDFRKPPDNIVKNERLNENPMHQTNVPSYYVPPREIQTPQVTLFNVGKLQSDAVKKENQLGIDIANQTSVPSYFLPSNIPVNVGSALTDQQSIFNVEHVPNAAKTEKPHIKDDKQAMYSLFNPVADSSPANVQSTSILNPLSSKNISVEDMTSSNVNLFGQAQSTHPTIPVINQTSKQDIPTPQSIIPPPPMFSNIQKRDSQIVEKSILPPSVARRISGKQPLIKTQAPPMTTYSNIFVPTPITDIPQSAPTNTWSTGTLVQPPLAFASSISNIFTPAYDESLQYSKPSNSPTTLATNAEPVLSPLSLSSTRVPSAQSLASATLPPSSNIVTQTDAISQTQFTLTSPQSVPAKMPLPPMISDTTTVIPQMHLKEEENIPYQTLHQDSSAYYESKTTTAPPKPISEPPKSTVNMSFRMTKKKPQYYLGPIGGVNTISEVKPTLPQAPMSAFESSFFTPGNQTSESSALLYPDMRSPVTEQYALNTQQSTVPFDISRPAEPESTNVQPDYYTMFDFSRPTTDSFEAPKEEPKGFGIIGSLKSKLSSIDINKIQNTVTTFFDPSYNDVKKDISTQENVTYGQYENQSSYDQYAQTMSSNFDIFVPNVEQPVHGHGYDYQRQKPLSYTQSNQYYQFQDNSHQDNNIYQSSGYGTEVGKNFIQENLEKLQSNNDQVNNLVPTSCSQDGYDVCHVSGISKTNHDRNTAEKLSTEHLFDTKEISSQYNNEVLEDTISTLDIIQGAEAIQNENLREQDKEIEVSSTGNNAPVLLYSAADFFTPANQNEIETEGSVFGTYKFENKITDVFGAGTKDKKQDVYMNPKILNTIPIELFTSASPQKLPSLESDVTNLVLEEKQIDIETLFDRKSNMGFFDKHTGQDVPENIALSDQENVHDLDICETCREITQPGEKSESLTEQLIENITAPIQLSNPVVATLPESNTPDEETIDFDSDQCAEISQITEETIETIQVQSATELLEDDVDEENVRNYVWCPDETFPTKVLLDHDYNLQPSATPEQSHDYTFEPDSNAIGLFEDNSLFFDNMPTNASDEIKAEFKTHEDIHILPRQMSIPSAPPAEDFDDTKSDETGGIDVQSIEQDAKKDFPIFEEYLIEPSETDDDKIEVRERERSSEDSAEDVDTFTNRIEKFKKMEESGVCSNITSPAVTMASYFDTGNYAAESHYRNTITSPNTLLLLSIRIPPGFEEEYRRRLSGMAALKRSSIPRIPDTTTQTSLSHTLTYSNMLTSQYKYNNSETRTAEAVEVNNYKQPHFQTALSRHQQDIPTIESNLPSMLAQLQMSSSTKDTTSQETEKLPAFTSSLVNDSEMQAIESSATGTSQVATEPLTDSLNFFSSSETQESSDSNRLASYFASPTKNEHGRPFFELSQGQDHYRQTNPNELKRFATTHRSFETETAKGHKHFFELSQSQDHYMDKQDTNVATLNLMRDLTSFQNLELTSDQVVRTVNYFTVDYDNDSIRETIGEPGRKNVVQPSVDLKISKSNAALKQLPESEETEIMDDIKCENLVNNCKYCCNLKGGRIVNLDRIDFESAGLKIRKTMNTSDAKKESDNNMDDKDSAKKRSVNVSFEDYSLHQESNEGVAMMSENRSSSEYTPVKHHWFYRVDLEGKSIWRGFSVADNRALEDAYHSPDLNENTLVATDGGRYDVNILGRLRMAVYWSDKPTNVRRCSWFYKGTTDARYVPYTEAVAEKLEEEYRHGLTTGEWHRRLMLPNNEVVVMHGPAVMVHLLQSLAADTFTSATQSTMRPRVVRRGHDESEIEDTEPSSVDHLLLLCHGVGSACDMRFRAVEEVVDDFRATSLQLIQSHYRNSFDNGLVGRVEVLPISWHSTLHTGEAGVDRRLARVTLDSIPRLRSFTNDTVLDVLFYTSPVFCQIIIDTVCKELNRIYSLFKSRNPNFEGGVSLGGHSLGSVILYDLLCHQQAVPSDAAALSEKKYVTGSAGTGQPSVRYPSLEFSPAALYALGSPIAIFECIRGVEALGTEFCLPTCPGFFNIFHPYDPIAYRIEPLVNPQLKNFKPSLIPHHKGRKRMHLELKETMARVGADIKQKLIESIKTTWSNMWRSQPPSTDQLEKVVEEEIEKGQLNEENKEDATPNDVTSPDMLGRLNSGRRVDYVLQEAPLEMINEYLFAMTSHVGYWESEDTMLLILREIYDALGVQPDSSVPQHTMTVQRARSPRPEETTVMNATEHPSTSRGSPC